MTATVAVFGLSGLSLALTFIGGSWSLPAILLGAASGVTGAVSVSLLYACLAIGPMSILSPLTAAVGAVVPMSWGLLGGERLGHLGYLGLALALLAVILVGFIPHQGAVRPTRNSVLMAVGAGATGGAFIIMLDSTPPDSGLVPLVLNRAVSATVMWSALLVLRLLRARGTNAHAARGLTAPGGPAVDWRGGLWLAMACGVLDTAGMVVVLTGLRVGNLSVLSVLSSMYPAGTVLLAAVVLGDRIVAVQWVGLMVALTAVGLLAGS